MSISLPITTEQSWTFHNGLNPQGPLLALSDEVIHITRSGDINARNQVNRIKLPSVTWTDNTLLNFELKYNELSSNTEVKMDYPGGVILRHNNGATLWTYFDSQGHFQTIGESNINFGDGTFHQVSLAYNGGDVDIFEDGELKGTKSLDGSASYSMDIGFQILLPSTALDAELKDIKVMAQLD